MYTFTHIDTCVGSIIDFIEQPVTSCNKTPTSFKNLIGNSQRIAMVDKIFVRGPDRCGNVIQHEMPIKVTISAQSNDPMELFAPEEWGQYVWNVEIRICPKAKRGIDGNCFYMQVFIPVGTCEGVVVSWLNQIMIDPISHTQITPKQCFVGKLPNYQWGTLFMNLYEAFTMAFASQIPMPTVGGLVDDAFVNYCNGPVVFSDFRRLIGADPWYETFGFYMANADEYRHALADRYTNALARDSVMNNYNIYKRNLQMCRESEPDLAERVNVCETLGVACDNPSCPGGSCMMRHLEMYSYIGDKIKANQPKACQWISDLPPLPSSCLMAFNRHKNSQTINIDGQDYVVRLKFYTVDEDSYA